MRVLVVEDEDVLADTIADGLREQAVAVDVVYDGAAALYRTSFTDYDVIVLDRDLPRVHGDDVCRQLVARRTAGRILMLTAAGEVDERVDGLSLGADDYLAKPFDPRELLARIRSVLRRVGINRKLLRARGKGSKPRQLRAHPPGSASGAAGSIWMPGGCSRPMVPRCRSRPCSST
jgi:DNA-binding response OmpR family regulator